MRKVLVGISGGVDSSVTALLLKNQGYEVEGVLLKQVNEPTDCDDYVCCAETAISRAREVCEQLKITLHTPDIRAAFNRSVIQPSLEVWASGGVPSPCTTCNSKVRAPFLNYYADVLRCDYFATGHYFINDGGRVYMGVDPSKDQSYMVSFVNPKLFGRWLTPLGNYYKSEVRKVAEYFGISTAHTPDSQNLCFDHLVPDLERPVFKQNGDALIQIGMHKGRPALGQRKGFGGDTVVAVDSEKIVISKEVKTSNNLKIRWVNYPGKTDGTVAQLAYHGKYYEVLEMGPERIVISEPKVISTGQTIAIYSGKELVGGGVFEGYV